MAEFASRQTGQRVAFEISILNVDKPPLDFLEMKHRLAQFAEEEPIWFTSLPTFAEKARFFRDALFVVGLDTIRRIGEQKYYGGPEELEAALGNLESNGARFLVFGRLDDDSFLGLNEISLPARLRRLCEPVSEKEFRCDVSSTEIRQRETGIDNP
jgi:hypothetical protein